jgi:hypothetical protein
MFLKYPTASLFIAADRGASPISAFPPLFRHFPTRRKPQDRSRVTSEEKWCGSFKVAHSPIAARVQQRAWGRGRPSSCDAPAHRRGRSHRIARPNERDDAGAVAHSVIEDAAGIIRAPQAMDLH